MAVQNVVFTVFTNINPKLVN